MIKIQQKIQHETTWWTDAYELVLRKFWKIWLRYVIIKSYFEFVLNGY